MATGYALPSPETSKGDGTIALQVPQSLEPWGGFDAAAGATGPRTDTQPTDALAVSVPGSLQPMFGFADWYDRIHITPGVVDLGNVVSQQTQNVVVWNAYTVPKTLNSITASGEEGISLTEPSPAPLVFEGLRERTYTAVVGTDGPATIDAVFVFDFSGANDPTLHIVGSRIIAWTWSANWAEPIVERLDWRTDVLTAYDGTEQRVKLREWPRRALEFGFSAQDRQRRRLQAALYGWGARVWAVPVWTDGERLQSSLSIGGLSVPATPATRDYRAGGLVMLLADDGTHEVVEVANVGSSSLTLARPLLRAWPAGSCMVYPVRLGRLQDSQTQRNFTGDVAFGRARMDLQDVSEWPAAVETTYRSQPVLTERPNWIADVDVELIRKLAELDFGTGVRAFDDESDAPEIRQSFRWFLESRTRIAAFRSWLYARAGKFKAVWVPSWTNDLVMKSNLGAAGTTFDVENVGYTRQVAARVHRRDIRIELTSGAVYYRRITGATEIDDDTEILSIDTALGVSITPASVVSISYLALCRLDADGVELAWFTGDAAEAATNLRATRAEP